MTYWQSQHFKALQQAWYAKLKAGGFEDAEEMIAGELVLKQIAAHPYRGLDSLGIMTKEAYYRLLGTVVLINTFECPVDQIIMTMFAEGARRKAIMAALKAQGAYRCRETIRKVIRKYEMRWGLREYVPQIMSPRKATKSA